MKKLVTVLFLLLAILASAANYMSIAESHEICQCEDDKAEVKKEKSKIKDYLSCFETVHLQSTGLDTPITLQNTSLPIKETPDRQTPPPEHCC